jgi:exosortase
MMQKRLMTADPALSPKIPWAPLAWFTVLVLACDAPVVVPLVRQWAWDDDMGHGFFVPVIAAYIAWQRRHELLAITAKPNWWGLVVALWGCLQVVVGTLGVELFTARTAVVITVIGLIWFLCGTEILRKLAFPLFLLFFMVPIPAVIYTQITFPLQILASKLADFALTVLGIPVLREGNILELPSGPLSVVEACSGIRSLLSLTFLSLVYGYLFEKQTWRRVVIFLATIPVALIANGGRVTLTGVLSQISPDLAHGFFHESTGMATFFAAAVMLFLLHQALLVPSRIAAHRRVKAVSRQPSAVSHTDSVDR